MDEEDITDNIFCPACSSLLTVPYIRCTECLQPDVYICLNCFAKGVEFKSHQNNHCYSLIRKDFPLFEDKWTAVDECNLLKAIEEFGYGNWKEISEHVKSKSTIECERHYDKYYIENPSDEMPGEVIVFSLSNSCSSFEDPPRPPEGSSIYNDMGGYCAARGDFTVEYDNYSESTICNIDISIKNTHFFDTVYFLLTELIYAAANIYNSSLKERDRRKKIVRDYGLISMSKVNSINKRYSKTIYQWLDGLRVYCTLFNPIEYDQLLESLHYEQELKNDIKKLKEYRQNGLTELRNIRLYKCMKKRREITKNRRHFLSDLINHVQDEEACISWLQKQAVANNRSTSILPLPQLQRRTPQPLDITSYPSFDKLSATEKEVCSYARLLPEAFMEFKRILIKESEKNNGILRLAHARSLIKIDVNKTRKIYDHLLNEGLVNKE
ncbi:hypothetical protein LOTGIDRAFT_114873 [Lottia gigantea]|uniref:Transcriptional adapter n=1 Tax=Lottia gigantea TaxID=225164 RepID=V4AUI8_LOTGI|nr:hypothetical protein LOTGIDRAFT_114873 [Lottia gigantea]ESO97431.1 hypothetical protein LOTGIDRAFT_114873 [Lottia gigantea]